MNYDELMKMSNLYLKKVNKSMLWVWLQSGRSNCHNLKIEVSKYKKVPGAQMTIEAALVVRQRVNKGFLNRFTSMQQEEFYLY